MPAKAGHPVYAGLAIDSQDRRLLDRPPSRAITAGNYATLSRIAVSAALIAAGVPTCIQVPSSRSPNRRPASIARSNIRLSENAPFGAFANSAGLRIAAPA